MTQEEPSTNVGHLRWQCRRGMRELDLLFEDFLENRYRALSKQQQGDFRRLLEYPDPLLRDWLLGRDIPPEPWLERLVALIRSSVES